MFGEAKDLTRGNTVGRVLLFTIPLLIGNVFQQFYNMADMIIVGRTISTSALAAIGTTGSIAFLVVGFSFGLTSGFTVITAQRFGAGDMAGVRRSIATSMILSLCVAAVVTFLATSTAPLLFRLMDTPPDILDDAYAYIIVIYGGFVATMFFNLFSGILRALGDSLTPLVFLVVACVVNIVLDYVLIVNFHTGVAGAGWATVAAQVVSVALCAVYSLRKFPAVRLRRSDFRFDRAFAWRHLSIGLSMGSQMSIIAVGIIVLQVGINRLGTDAVKAFSAAIKIDQFATLPLFSLGIAVATFTAQNFGARKFARIRECARKCSVVAVLMSVAGCALMIATGRFLLSQFGIDESEPGVVRDAVLYLNTTSLFYFVLGILFVLRNILQGMGKNTMPMASAAVEVAARIVATFTIVEWWGFWGVCVVNPATWVGAVAMLVIGYVRAMRDIRREAPGNFESVVLHYDAQAKFAPPMESVPSASVRLLVRAGETPGAKQGSVRLL
jgi:putative MATE family efflux protein